MYSSFSLYWYRAEVYNEEYILFDDTKYIGDLLSEIKSSEDELREDILESKLVFRKRLLREPDESVTDPVFIQLLYAQVQHDYILGKYPVGRDVAAKLSALQTLVAIGFINDPKSSLEWMSRFLPRQIEVTRAKNDWEHEITACYQLMKHLSKDDARRQFLRIFTDLPYGNSVFFGVHKMYDNIGILPGRIILGINKKGVHFFCPVSPASPMEYLLSAELRDIKRYGSSDIGVFFQMRVAGGFHIFQFETKQAEEICVALQMHINDAMESRTKANSATSETYRNGVIQPYKAPNVQEPAKAAEQCQKEADMEVQRLREQLTQTDVEESRMDDIIREELEGLECIVDGTKEPSNLKFLLLEHITKNFSDELKIGSGGSGDVYKGKLQNRYVAVKKLSSLHTVDEKMFKQELVSMISVRHENIVRLLGYCSHTEEQIMEVNGKFVMVEIRERLLCFEFISNGSLQNYITDELRGIEWHTRYQIIKGICEGLKHLHKEKTIVHMDLKPANILLDDHMVPKIADFGLSRLDDTSQTRSTECYWTPGYCAPEYMHHGKRSAKSDIYSLGVILLEVVTGSKEEQDLNKVLRRWKDRWHESEKDISSGYKQVAKCLDLARRCMNPDPTDRPDILDVINELNNIDPVDSTNVRTIRELDNMLGVQPLKIQLPLEVNKQTSRSIKLTNKTDDHFAFRVSTTRTSPSHYVVEPTKGIVPPVQCCNNIPRPEEGTSPRQPQG